MNIEDCCDSIDAGFFSGDYFHDVERVKEIERWMLRWKREIVVIKLVNYYREVYVFCPACDAKFSDFMGARIECPMCDTSFLPVIVEFKP